MGKFALLVVLGALSAFGPLATDMYLPALPEVARSLHASAAAVQATIATFFLGFTVGQLIYGPLADHFGRKPPLYWGLALYTAASALCAIVPTADGMIALRLVEALGACAGSVVSRAIVRDLFPPDETARVFSLLMLVFVLAPIFAPLIGGYLMIWFGWRSIFWALALSGALSIAASLRLPESHTPDPGHPLAIGPVLRVYLDLLSTRHFIVPTAAGSIAFAGLFAYLAGSPFVFIQGFGLTPEHYSWLFAINAGGIMLVSQSNRMLIGRVGPARLMRAATLIQVAAGAALPIAAHFAPTNMWCYAVPLLIYISMSGSVGPNSAALALAEQGGRAGAAAALLGSFQFLSGTFTALFVGAIRATTPLPMAATIALVSVLAPLVLYMAHGAEQRALRQPSG